MKQVVILSDVMGAPQRLESLRRAGMQTHCVTTSDRNFPHAKRIVLPDAMLPTRDDWSVKRKGWHKGSLLGQLAAKNIKSDFYWFIESDCCAAPETWATLFSHFANNPADLVTGKLRDRKNYPQLYRRHHGTPDWGSHLFLLAIYRLSRRALDLCLSHAEEDREVFCEISVASRIMQAGYSYSYVNETRTFWNRQTFSACPKCVILNPALVNHPVKYDSIKP